ncbi:hypothetical protein [Pseudobacteroides cellulosolvens]|uniref:hypothetical protein n=1 Tax=Pseudobacteroides cellulosolvens TaxID=35825 RepID=UPI00128F9013|nr:hypothetical protein [Pseudobacteroides cellulosolvens]
MSNECRYADIFKDRKTEFSCHLFCKALTTMLDEKYVKPEKPDYSGFFATLTPKNFNVNP